MQLFGINPWESHACGMCDFHSEWLVATRPHLFPNRPIGRQRNPSTGLKKAHYRDSRASATPFKNDSLNKRHTAQINPQPGSSTATNSVEEFPWESMRQGGTGPVVMPATRDQQNRTSYDSDSLADPFIDAFVLYRSSRRYYRRLSPK